MINPVSTDKFDQLKESPCKVCKKRLTSKNWEADICIESCEILNKREEFTCQPGEYHHTDHKVKCPFEDCSNTMGYGAQCCQDHLGKIWYRKFKLKLPPELIFKKKPAKQGTYEPYQWTKLKK